jgi:serine phosphatase RsbU (regulator of sigma subunit)
MRKFNLTILAIFLSSTFCFSQTEEIIQLRKKSETAQGQERIKILDKLAEAYLDYDLAKSVNYAEMALNESKTTNIPESVSGNLYNTLGAAYYYQGQLIKSQQNYEKELIIIQNGTSVKNIIKTLYNIAVLYQHSGKTDKAEKYFLMALDKSKEIQSDDLTLKIYRALYTMSKEDGATSEAFNYLEQYVSLKDTKFNQTKENVSILRKNYQDESDLLPENTDKFTITDSILTLSDEKKLTLTDSQKKARQTELKYLEKIVSEKLNQQQGEINETRVILKNAETERKNMQTIMSVIISILTLAGGIWVYFLYRQKRHSHEILMMQKNQIKAQTKVLREKNTQIIDSINYARRIQDSILMPESEIQKYLPDAFIFYKPKEIISGDFYWFSKVDDKLILAAIDCTGHGVPGAFMSMVGNMLLNEIVNEHRITKPDEILKLLHKGVVSALSTKNEAKAEDGMDMSLCTIDPKQKRFQFAGAKNHLYVIQGDKLKVLKAGSFSIGGRPLREDVNIEFTSYDFMYDDKTSIYMMSDGYMDQFGGLEDTKFNSTRFKEMLLENRALSMNMQKEVISKTLNEWKGNKDQVDDILVLGVKLQ